MATFLITGASGFIGRALAASLARGHEVLCMSRQDPRLDLPWIKGDFGSFEDLRQLDGQAIDGVVHLAAVTGAGHERQALRVNVEGTRGLMRYLADRGCRKFVMASSIAAVGFQSPKFRPLQVPIPDEHPCLDRNGYGLSKFMMEEITRYVQRQTETIDVINLRLSTVRPDDDLPPPQKVGPLGPWSLGGITVMALSDAVRAFSLAIESPLKPGVRVLNATAPKAWVADPVAAILKNWWGDAVDVGYFENSQRQFASVYTVERIEAELGFVAERLP